MHEIIIQSDNESCFTSQDLIPFIYHLNNESSRMGLPIITKWIFTEYHTGRGKLDTHFSFMNLVLKSFVEDGNDVVIEDHIVDAISFRGGMSGTAGIFLNCTNLPTSTICKKIKSKAVKCRGTHKIVWDDKEVFIFEASGITTPEIVASGTMDKHTLNDLNITVEKVFQSLKPPHVVT